MLLLLNKNFLAVLLLGFASGLPLALIAGTLQARLFEEGLSLSAIALFAYVQTPFTIKYLWAPFLDWHPLPFLDRRRGWILVSQLILVILIYILGAVTTGDLHTVAIVALLIGFFSATQDIVIDAYRTELLKQEQLAFGVGVSITGYRLGMLTSGALALILAEHYSWSTVYQTMAGIMAVSAVGTIIAPRLSDIAQIERRTFQAAIIQPFLSFIRRSYALEIVAFVVLYKLGDAMAASLTTPFMLSVGFSKQEIGAVTKGFGLLATIAGGLLGGAITIKLGFKRALILFGVFQAVSTLMFSALAVIGKSLSFMSLTIAVENICGGLGTAAFVGFLSVLCKREFTATHFAMLTSFASIARVFISGHTGSLAEDLGWVGFFVLSTVAALPGIVILLRLDKWRESDYS